MLLIHKMSSQSQGILDVALNVNADPLSKNWGFQHTPSSSSPAHRVYLVRSHTIRALWSRTNPSNRCDHWLHFLQPVVSQGRMELPGCFYTDAC